MAERKKQIRHKSKYLGRNLDGQPVQMRKASAETKEKAKKKTITARSSHDYGSIMILESIAEDLGLNRYLGELLSVSEAAMVRARAFNRIIRPTAMKNDYITYIDYKCFLGQQKASAPSLHSYENSEYFGDKYQRHFLNNNLQAVSAV